MTRPINLACQRQKERTLVHIDAHDDLWWTPGSRPFILPILSLGPAGRIVRKSSGWCRIKPGSPQFPEAFSRRLRKFSRAIRGMLCHREVETGQISTVSWGSPCGSAPWAICPGFKSNVLLDIDVDFFTISRPAAPYEPALPWCGPDDLLARLKARTCTRP